MNTQNLRKRFLDKRWLSLSVVILLILIGLSGGTTALSQVADDGEIVRIVIARRNIKWVPLVEHGGIVLTISGPGGVVLSRTFGPTEVPVFRSMDASGDGLYRYELRVLPADDEVAPE